MRPSLLCARPWPAVLHDKGSMEHGNGAREGHMLANKNIRAVAVQSLYDLPCSPIKVTPSTALTPQ